MTDLPASDLDPPLAGRLAALALGHVGREFPNKLDHVLDGAGDLLSPRALHPVFFGSFDWHSCVHAFWMLAHLRRRFPNMAEAAAIDALFDARLVPGLVAVELAYLRRPAARGFERTYGWAWLLRLQSELLRDGGADGRRRAGALAPLAREFAERLRGFLPLATFPIRAGTHANSAFALLLALDYARLCKDEALAALIAERAETWFAGDRDCQAWEPGGDDFLSPALIEAALMQSVRPAATFAPWLAGFLPRIGQRLPESLHVPATVSDRTDGKIAHLDGLNLSRAWCWRRLARALPAGEARDAAEQAARLHLQAGLPHVAGHYAGEHWLATYAVLALSPDGDDAQIGAGPTHA